MIEAGLCSAFPFFLKITVVEFLHKFNYALCLQGRFDRRDLSISDFACGSSLNSPGAVRGHPADYRRAASDDRLPGDRKKRAL